MVKNKIAVQMADKRMNIQKVAEATGLSRTTLSAMVNDKKNEEMDLNELYHNFDQAFLRIYPNFVNEVNKLLKKEEVYNLKEGTLNTELRIFALIRLGINDTNQISEFLRYSLRTIYNYRSKVKAKSVIENDEFEAKIMQIGSIITS